MELNSASQVSACSALRSTQSHAMQTWSASVQKLMQPLARQHGCSYRTAASIHGSLASQMTLQMPIAIPSALGQYMVYRGPHSPGFSSKEAQPPCKQQCSLCYRAVLSMHHLSSAALTSVHWQVCMQGLLATLNNFALVHTLQHICLPFAEALDACLMPATQIFNVSCNTCQGICLRMPSSPSPNSSGLCFMVRSHLQILLCSHSPHRSHRYANDTLL